jgi:hypothetical protein
MMFPFVVFKRAISGGYQWGLLITKEKNPKSLGGFHRKVVDHWELNETLIKNSPTGPFISLGYNKDTTNSFKMLMWVFIFNLILK